MRGQPVVLSFSVPGNGMGRLISVASRNQITLVDIMKECLSSADMEFDYSKNILVCVFLTCYLKRLIRNIL